jgi:hypothetical protein
MEEAIPIHKPPTKEEIKSICASINSTFGHLKCAMSYNLRKNLTIVIWKIKKLSKAC